MFVQKICCYQLRLSQLGLEQLPWIFTLSIMIPTSSFAWAVMLEHMYWEPYLHTRCLVELWESIAFASHMKTCLCLLKTSDKIFLNRQWSPSYHIWHLKFRAYLYRRVKLVTNKAPHTDIYSKEQYLSYASSSGALMHTLSPYFRHETHYKMFKQYGNAHSLLKLPLLEDRERKPVERKLFPIAQLKQLPLTVTQIKQDTQGDRIFPRYS